MKVQKISITYQCFDNPSGLGEEDASLLSEASLVTGKAYAPYSGFRVGAAVKLRSGRVVTGSNQENIAYPSGLCAERVALFFASSNFPDDPVEALAVNASASDFTILKPVMPCGACRQVLAEYQQKQQSPIRLVLGGGEGPVFVFSSVEDILPMMFTAEGLKKNKHNK